MICRNLDLIFQINMNLANPFFNGNYIPYHIPSKVYLNIALNSAIQTNERIINLDQSNKDLVDTCNQFVDQQEKIDDQIIGLERTITSLEYIIEQRNDRITNLEAELHSVKQQCIQCHYKFATLSSRVDSLCRQINGWTNNTYKTKSVPN